MNLKHFSPTNRGHGYGYAIPGYTITVDGSEFVAIIHDAMTDIARTGRRLDFESLGQYLGVDAALLRKVVSIEAVPS